jgi:hypothetical protein
MLELGGDLTEDVDRLGLERLEVGQLVGGHWPSDVEVPGCDGGAEHGTRPNGPGDRDAWLIWIARMVTVSAPDPCGCAATGAVLMETSPGGSVSTRLPVWSRFPRRTLAAAPQQAPCLMETSPGGSVSTDLPEWP